MTVPEQAIRQEISRQGSVSFARFMEMALYGEGGYYTQPRPVTGRGGDFITNVSVGPLFGRLVAFQFAEWITSAGVGHPILLETGADDGRLALDVLDAWAENYPGAFLNLRYWILEPFPSRQETQRATLQKHMGKVSWFKSWEGISNPLQDAVIFSNELLDAFPVHLLSWNKGEKRWMEKTVVLENGRLAWGTRPLEAADDSGAKVRLADYLTAIPSEMEKVLPDQFTIEVSPRAEEWWRTAAAKLQRGWLLTCDYGLLGDEWLHPRREQGTLRAYRRQTHAHDIFQDPGTADLTTHVRFDRLKQIGEQAGLTTVFLGTQEKFLVEIAEKFWKDKGHRAWSVSQVQQFKMLVHPEHFGRAFKCLVQRSSC